MSRRNIYCIVFYCYQLLFQPRTPLLQSKPPQTFQAVNNKIKINIDLEVADPQSGSSSTRFLVELQFGNVAF